MSKLDDSIGSAMGLDVEQAIRDTDQDISELDQKDIDRYNERKDIVTKIKHDLVTARSLNDSDWAKALLKKSAEKIIITQEIFGKEIEEDPDKGKVSALGELSNALTSTIKGVLDVDREREKIEISREKMTLRQNASGGKTLDADGKVIIGVGSNDDILNLIKNGINPLEIEKEPEGEEDATTTDT